VALSPFPLNFTITQGDDCPLQWTYTREGAAEDVSGWQFWLTVKASYDDEDVDALVALDPTDFTVSGPDNNVVTTLIPRTATSNMAPGNYHVDLQVARGGLIETHGVGTCVIRPQATVRAT
jgi:hypothetical protein